MLEIAGDLVFFFFISITCISKIIFSFITVMPELVPVAYPRFCPLISCPDYLTHIADKQADIFFFLLQCLVFYFLFSQPPTPTPCVYARLFVRARLRSFDG